MAGQGWRLHKTNPIYYDFTSCEANTYEYRLDFVALYSNQKLANYTQLLLEQGYNCFFKNLNINFSLGKMRFRPYAEKGGHLASTTGTYNKEILIIEKKRDEESFDIHSNYRDIVKWLISIRRIYLAYLFAVTVSAIFLIWLAYNIWLTFALIIGFGILLSIVLHYTRSIVLYKRKSRIHE